MQAFLSHSSDDKALATTIERLLRDEAVAVWFDRLELRPGDSLLKKIGEGISSSDFLLVLVTDNSMRSAWVEKEIEIALTQEINGKGPKVIPLLHKGCEIPAILADKYYVTIDEHANGAREIIPAIFRDSYIFDISLNAEELGYDEQKLQEELYEYTRTKYNNLRVRIDNRNFNAKVMEIVDKATSLHATPQHVVAQIKRIAKPFPIELPIYWVNLATLLGQLLNQVFGHYGKNMDAVNLAVESVARSLDLAQSIMCSRISGAVFAIHAQQFEHSDIAAYVRRFEDIEGHDDYTYEENLVRKVCQIRPDYHLAFVGIEGNRSRRVVDAKIHLPILSKDDCLRLQITCPPQEIIMYYSWYCWCLPQILGHFLQWTAFREAKPLHELDYSIGLSLDDYDRIGYA